MEKGKQISSMETGIKARSENPDCHYGCEGPKAIRRVRGVAVHIGMATEICIALKQQLI